jgi:hypothetical protein
MSSNEIDSTAWVYGMPIIFISILLLCICINIVAEYLRDNSYKNRLRHRKLAVLISQYEQLGEQQREAEKNYIDPRGDNVHPTTAYDTIKFFYNLRFLAAFMWLSIAPSAATVQDKEQNSMETQPKKKCNNLNRIIAFVELFQFILPRTIRREAFEPAYNEIKKDYLLAQQYKSKWAKRWLCFCFICQTTYMIGDCFRVFFGSKLKSLLLLLVPVGVRELIEIVRRFFGN